MSKVIPMFKQRLVADQNTGKVTANPPSDFGDRLQRIRTSLEKINHLMAELKEKKS